MRCAYRMLLGSALLVALAMPGSALGAPAGWANSSLRSVASSGILTANDVQRPELKMRRGAFAAALIRLEQARAEQGGEVVYQSARGKRAYPDAPVGSTGARVLELGWMAPVAGGFAAEQPVTADEAARGLVAVLGLRPDAIAFAKALRREVPGVRGGYETKSYQVFIRALGMRYNHPQGQEQNEVSPKEPMSVAHVAYMLDRALSAAPWRTEWVSSTYADFDLPELGANQRRVMATAVGLVGEPYVWAGETEGTQSEGHGGFDCSGFTWRVLNGSRLPAGILPPVRERTSMTMSDIPARRRVRSAAQLRTGDMVFFGSRGQRSKPAQNFHVGVAMGNGWFIHSSGGNGGVTIQRLDGWWATQFSWGRRSLKVQ